MGWLTTNRERPTVRAKVRGAVTDKRVARGVALCQECDKPITGAKAGTATHHPRCARRAAAGW
jgi:hypothetical protein